MAFTNQSVRKVLLCGRPRPNQLIKFMEIGPIAPMEVEAGKGAAGQKTHKDAPHTVVISQVAILLLIEIRDLL